MFGGYGCALDSLGTWTSAATGVDRGAVALAFLSSSEARRNLVKEQLLRFLDRQPTSTGTATWAARMTAADGEIDLIAFLGASNAYLIGS